MSNASEYYKALTIDSILVSQKDNFIYDINTSINTLEMPVENSCYNEYATGACETLRAVLYSLRAVKDLWVANSYGYKFNELLRRIDESVCDIRSRIPETRKVARRELREVYQQVKTMYIPAELNIV